MLCQVADLIVIAIRGLLELVEIVLSVFPGLTSYLADPLLQAISSFGCQL